MSDFITEVNEIVAVCRKECHCMLFLTEDNDFAGREQVRVLPRQVNLAVSIFFALIPLHVCLFQEIGLEEIKELTAGF